MQVQQRQYLGDRELVGAGWEETGLVFTWPDGRPLHPDLITDWFKRLSSEAGLPSIRLHDVRHSYATAALKAGIPAKVVSERLGHANITITLDTYSHVLPGMDAAAANLVADLILGSGASAGDGVSAVAALGNNDDAGPENAKGPGTENIMMIPFGSPDSPRLDR
jgi:hypothetical protein